MRVFEGAGFIHSNVPSWDSCQFTLPFDDSLIIDMVFAGLVVKAHKLIRIAKASEFQVHILVDLKLPLADGCANLDMMVFQVASSLLPDMIKYLKRNFLYCALPSGMDDTDDSTDLIMKDHGDTVGSEGTK